MTTYAYSTNASRMTTVVATGVPGTTDTNVVVRGLRTTREVGLTGELLVEMSQDIESGVVHRNDVYGEHDPEGRPGRVLHLDGTSEYWGYGCCGLESWIDREGVQTVYGNDAMGRRVSEGRLGIINYFHLDALGRATNVVRIGTNGTAFSLEQTRYDLSGRVVFKVDAASRTNVYSYTNDAAGRPETRTVYAVGTTNASTRIETRHRDGALYQVTGTAVTPERYYYGVDQAPEGGSTWLSSVLAVKLDAAGNETLETTRSLLDFAGRTFLVQKAGQAGARDWLDMVGRVVKHRDADGVVTLRTYNAEGEPDMVAADLDGDSVIDLDSDRVTKTVSDFLTNSFHGFPVRRTRIYGWDAFGEASSNLLSTSETSVDGLRSWAVVNGHTNSQVTAIDPVNRLRTVIQTTSDGSSMVTVHRDGRLDSVTRKDSYGIQVGRTEYRYDAHGRQSQVVDARNGTTTYVFDGADRVVSVTTPPAENGQPAQTTVSEYDAAGRVWRLIQPDGTSVTNSYYPNGLLRRSSGSRTYPVEYTYDSQGRMKTMTTWRQAGAGTGASTTTWNYLPETGWLRSKIYADGRGTTNGYSEAGRLKSRTWARGPPSLPTNMDSTTPRRPTSIRTWSRCPTATARPRRS